MESSYPDKFLRGISGRDCVDDRGYVYAGAFQFDRNPREDGYNELSINWCDDIKARDVLLEQCKADGAIQFKIGYAELDLLSVKSTLKLHIDNKTLNYERKPIEGNEYHGNLLLNRNSNKQTEKLITNALAVLSTFVRREDLT